MSYFITLTYDNQHLPLSTEESIVDDGIGRVTHPYLTRVWRDSANKFDNTPVGKAGYYYEKRDRVRYKSVSPDGVCGFLCRKDVQDFMKRLRKVMDKYYHVHIQMFGCGEYGGDAWSKERQTYGTSRPHYHILVWFDGLESNKELFGYSIPVDKRAFFKGYVPKLTQTTFKMIVDRCWSKSSGRTLVVEPTRNIEATSRYVTKYILKEMEQHKHRNDYCCQRVPMFRMFSQHIGLEGAINYLENLRKQIAEGVIELPTYHKVAVVDHQLTDIELSLPSYYSRYAFKQLGYENDKHFDQTACEEVLAARDAIKRLWQLRIEQLEKEKPTTPESIKDSFDKAQRKLEMELYKDYYGSRADIDHKLEWQRAIRQIDRDAKSLMEATDYTAFVYDNPYCLDAQIEDEIKALRDLRESELPFTIGILEDCPF